MKDHEVTAEVVAVMKIIKENIKKVQLENFEGEPLNHYGDTSQSFPCA
jgi:hypothetical protein